MTDAIATGSLNRVTGATAQSVVTPAIEETNRLAPLTNRPSQLDRTRPLEFTFNGRAHTGLAGDTLASALLANGTNFVARSFKYHRPRGIFTAGAEEPNALLTVGEGAATDPNSRATMVELQDGLVAKSQNHRGSLKHDLMAVNDLVSPFLTAGFYYKTFMWPRAFWEKLYEPVIRAAAGLGALSGEEDPDSYDHGCLHCDVLVIGSGPSGLSAALAAGRAGARVILVEEDFAPGGRLNAETMAVDDTDSAQWASRAVAGLRSMNNVRVMTRTCVFGAYDHGVYGLLETRTDHTSANAKPRQVMWRLYSKRAVLCAGALERPIAFADNDRPGVMLSSAVRTYANRFDVTPGPRVAVLTAGDDGYRTARDLAARGVEIAAVLDTRVDAKDGSSEFEIISGAHIETTSGRHGISRVKLADGRTIECDCLAVAGGYNPNVHLTCHQRGRPVWSAEHSAFVPSETPPGQSVAGAAKGVMSLGACLSDGHNMGAAAANDLGFKANAGAAARGDDEATGLTAIYHMPALAKPKGRAFVDLQNDVTTKDITQSHREGMTSVEHLKRYTTLGMATDQGKTSNITGLAVMAELTGATISQTGTTMFRPPVSPVAIGAFAGHARGKHFKPTRRTPSHNWATEQDAVFVETGLWLRAQYFPQAGETHWRQSVDREVMATRNGVGVCDVTTLGKIDVQGPDAAEFLNRIYANGFAKLPVGKCRYGLMLREDGIVMDDGTAARMAENHFVVTTTTANAGGVFEHMEFCRQCLWPDLDVHLVSTTDAWAQFAVAGPRSTELLRRIVDAEHDISNEAFPFMACGDISVCGGTPARLFRISFSGEKAYEIAVPTRYGDALIRTLMAAGEDMDVVAYGVEALGVMRIEKGHAAGNELDGRTTARDLGLGRMVSTKKDSIGAVLSRRPGLGEDDGHDLVGFVPVDQSVDLKAGSHLVNTGDPTDMAHDQGWLSSVCYSPELGHSIALGFVKHGTKRMGETLTAANPLEGQSTEVKVVSPHFIDPDGERMRG
ncbi:MAG: sarcosine oxidase subunit alpha family protein [Pseudomonadota bacterium]